MRIRVLREQIDLFEMSVLEQAGELSPDDIQEPSGEQRPVPLVLVGRCLKADRAGEIRDLARGVYRSGGAMLVVPDGAPGGGGAEVPLAWITYT